MLFNYQRRIQDCFYAKVTEVLYEVGQNADVTPRPPSGENSQFVTFI
jgi:hypothetical protein